LALAGRALADAPGEPPVVEDDGVGTGGDDAGAAGTADDDALGAAGDGDDDALEGDEVARSAADAGATFTEDAFVTTSGLVDATSLHDLEARHYHPSPWGRLDVGLTWRRVEQLGEPTRREIWVFATWRN
jgi:hypothetical protein